MMTPLAPEHLRCLAHPHPTHPAQAPLAWCPLRADCARHETIRIDVSNNLTVMRRVCGLGEESFIATEPEEE